MSKLFFTSFLIFFLTGQFALANITSLPKVKGVIRQVMESQNSLKIKHEEIPNLDMAAMTMTFLVANEDMLTNVSKNDKVLFSADVIDGELVVVWLEKE